jgi:hypothetical protein
MRFDSSYPVSLIGPTLVNFTSVTITYILWQWGGKQLHLGRRACRLLLLVYYNGWLVNALTYLDIVSLMSSKSAQVATLLTCIRKVPGSNRGRDTYYLVFSWFCSASPAKCQNIKPGYHSFYSHPLGPFPAIQWELLTASFKKLQIWFPAMTFL